jgi:tyrosine-specific transport protein
MTQNNSRFVGNLRAFALITGTTIGSGVLAIPYVVHQAGFFIGIGYLLGIGFVMLIIHLMLGEITLRTKGFHHLPGYANIYLGKTAKNIMFVANMILIYGAITAYAIGSGNTLSMIVPITPSVLTLMTFVVGALCVARGVKVVAQVELILMVGMITMVCALAMRAIGEDFLTWQVVAESNGGDISRIFGVIAFSYFGLTAIPDMRRTLGRYRGDMDQVIRSGIIVSMIIYTIFTITVLGMVTEVDEIATVSLGRVFGSSVSVMANVFALSAMLTSFFALGASLVYMFQKDYYLSRIQAIFLTLIPPLGLVVFGNGSFGEILSMTGAISGSVVGLLVVAMFWSAKENSQRVPEYSLGRMTIGGIAIGVFLVTGVIWQFLL